MSKQDNKYSFFSIVINKLKILVHDKQLSHTELEEYINNTDVDTEFHFKNISIHLAYDDGFRQTMRHEYGEQSEFESDKTVNKIITTIGYSKWKVITKKLYDLYPDYKNIYENIKKLEAEVIEQQELARKLSESIEKHDVNKYLSTGNNVFYGLLAKHTTNPNMVKIIESYSDTHSEKETEEAAMSMHFQMSGDSSLKALSASLRDYSDKLNETFKSDDFKSIKERFHHKKMSFHLYVESRILEIIRDVWPYERNPNKEISLITDLIIDPDDIGKVKNNNISQLNSKNRRKYVMK